MDLQRWIDIVNICTLTHVNTEGLRIGKGGWHIGVAGKKSQSQISNLKSQISNLKSQISNLKSQISNLKFEI
jgi:peptidoglycan hydrolase CwlO-like protein